MMIQETDSTSSLSTTQFVPGMRGVECSVANDGKVNWFVYDGHGNVVATIDGIASGQTWGTVRNIRHFDVWGTQRGSTTDASNSPKHEYCGNLGHTVDSELGGLIYMRARYYEPWTGRFVSEDPTGDGPNWYSYSCQDPVQLADASGRNAAIRAFAGIAAKYLWMFSVISAVVALYSSAKAAAGFAHAMASAQSDSDVETAWGQFMHGFNIGLTSMVEGSGNFGRGLVGVRGALSVTANIGQSSTMAGAFATIISGSLLGAQFAMLGLCYDLRISWYINNE